MAECEGSCAFCLEPAVDCTSGWVHCGAHKYIAIRNGKPGKVVEPWIQTYTGKAFDLLDPQPDMIDIRDIAHALSNLCRYNGHVRDFYSVAEHSYWASRFVDPEYRLETLLHDAAEAYVGDVTSPLKAQLPEYKRIEHRIEAVVREVFKLPATRSQAVTDSDHRMLFTEKQQLFRTEPPRPWGFDGEPYDQTICCWAPLYVERLFLGRFDDLINQVSR